MADLNSGEDDKTTRMHYVGFDEWIVTGGESPRFAVAGTVW